MNKHIKAALYTLLVTLGMAIFVALMMVTKGLIMLAIIPVVIYFVILDSL